MRTWKTCAAVILAAAVGATTAAPVPESGKPPTRPAPSLRSVHAADVEGGEIQWEVTLPRFVPVRVVRLVEVKGEKVNKEFTEYRTEMITQIQAMRLDAYKVLTADGQLLAKEDVAKRLVRGAVVLVCAEDRMPEPAYLKLFKPDTLILVLKEAPEFPIPAPVPPAPRRPS